MKERAKTITEDASTLANIAIFAPVALTVTSFILLVLINLIFNPTFWMTADEDPINSTPIFITVANIVLCIFAALGLVAILPGIIYGICSKLVHQKI